LTGARRRLETNRSTDQIASELQAQSLSLCPPHRIEASTTTPDNDPTAVRAQYQLRRWLV
jgi:hypothetical protein